MPNRPASGLVEKANKFNQIGLTGLWKFPRNQERRLKIDPSGLKINPSGLKINPSAQTSGVGDPCRRDQSQPRVGLPCDHFALNMGLGQGLHSSAMGERFIPDGGGPTHPTVCSVCDWNLRRSEHLLVLGYWPTRLCRRVLGPSVFMGQQTQEQALGLGNMHRIQHVDPMRGYRGAKPSPLSAANRRLHKFMLNPNF